MNNKSGTETYKDWRLISFSHRLDTNPLRVILGNDTAIEAARSGQSNPWPDGAILGKLVWKDSTLPSWEKAVVPSDFVHVDFMVKDSKKFQETGGGGLLVGKGYNRNLMAKMPILSMNASGVIHRSRIMIMCSHIRQFSHRFVREEMNPFNPALQ